MISKQETLREMKRFEFYKTRIWPVQRLFLKHVLTPRCTCCFLPRTYTGLENGVCGLCREPAPAEERPAPGTRQRFQAEFDRLMASAAARKDVNFHAMLLLSGGKDSTLLLHRLRTRYPDLRILAYTLDNTFMSPVALDNIGSVVRRFRIDHITVRPDAGLMEKMFRTAFTRTGSQGCAAVVDQFDGDFFSDAARNLAASLGIPYIFCGLSRDQVRHILKLDTFITSGAAAAETRKQVAGIPLAEVFSRQEMAYWWDGRAWPAEKRPRMIFPYFFWDDDESRIRSRVKELGLLPQGQESPLVTNSELIPLMGLADMARLGFSSFEPEFARKVRQGKADRKDWLHTFETLEYAARSGRLLSRSVERVMARLSLTRADLGIGGAAHE